MQISRKISVFHGIEAPEEGVLIGYGALLEAFSLEVPLPAKLSLISSKNRKYTSENWQVFTPRHLPEDNLYKQLVFALRYEGINLLLLKKLFEKLSDQEIVNLIKNEPLGQYSRKIWFLYEWFFQNELDIENLKTGNYIELVNPKIQYALSKGTKSSRHRVINNLTGTVDFCPMVFKTPNIEQYIKDNYKEQKAEYFKDVRKDIIQRASTFLLLKDSKASFTIEGESPKSKRTA